MLEAGDVHSSKRQYKCTDAAMKQHSTPATGPTLLYRSKRSISDRRGVTAILRYTCSVRAATSSHEYMRRTFS